VAVVVGVDSSTQSTKLVVRSLDDGSVVASGRAPHPPTEPPVSEHHPHAWWEALEDAWSQIGPIRRRTVGLSITGQGHGLVLLDGDNAVLRKAPLWNDTSSVHEARYLRDRLGRSAWARRTSIVPVSAVTISKLLRVALREPEILDRARTVLLPHDWIQSELTGEPSTDRSEASGTGWFDPATSTWQPDLLDLVRPGLSEQLRLPDVLGPDSSAGVPAGGRRPLQDLPGATVVGPGCNDNAGTALGLNLGAGDVVFSLGTSGTVFTPSPAPVHDESGDVDGNADATGAFLPLVCTLNAGKVLDWACSLLEVDYQTLGEMALAAPADPARPIMAAYLDGERTPDRPFASGVVSGLTNATGRQDLARAAIEGILLGLCGGLDSLKRMGLPCDGRVLLAGGGARSVPVAQLLADFVGREVSVCDVPDMAALGAAVQAAAVASDTTVTEVQKAWAPPFRVVAEPHPGQHTEEIRHRYRRLVATLDQEETTTR